MDKLKNVAKTGWHPDSDKQIHRDTWKSDVKNIATRKNKDPYEYARNHKSAPLASLQDPDAFGPPPKRSDSMAIQSPSSSQQPPEQRPIRRDTQQSQASRNPSIANPKQEDDEPSSPAPPLPFRIDSTGLRTDNLPKPPARRADGAGAARDSVSAASPTLTPRQPAVPANPPVQAQQRPRPPPTLPPRQNDHPDEYTPPAPPSYNESVAEPQQNPAVINARAAANLSQAGINVPGLEIGAQSGQPRQPTQPQGHGSQLSELQQRFARMNAGAGPSAPSSQPASAALATAASQKKKPPPPPPPKKPGLASGTNNPSSEPGDAQAPPPLPLSSKPRPG